MRERERKKNKNKNLGGGSTYGTANKKSSYAFHSANWLLGRQRRRGEFYNDSRSCIRREKKSALLCLQMGALRELRCGLLSNHRMDD